MQKLILCLMLTASVLSTAAQTGKLVSDKIEAATLKGNLIGDSVSRHVAVYLPPGYHQKPGLRYPVVYLLHGFTPTSNKTWVIENDGMRMNIGKMMDRLIASQAVRPMILVMPDASNKFGGSFYTNSVTTGNWEDYITQELVNYIDKRYRTLPKALSRGIMGHSMGGYGAIKLAMKNPAVYGAVYVTSPCCLDTYPNIEAPDNFLIEASKIRSWAEIETAGFFARTFLASAAAFSPNPTKPPFYADFPLNNNGAPDRAAMEAQARWLANTPMWMVDQNRTNLAKLSGIALDVGNEEELLTSVRNFSAKLKINGIEHSFEEFDGGHIDKTAERIETRILPYFSKLLKSSQSVRRK